LYGGLLVTTPTKATKVKKGVILSLSKDERDGFYALLHHHVANLSGGSV